VHLGEAASPGPPWTAGSLLLARAYALAAEAHAAQHRPSDDRPFLEHVVEVATLLHDAGFDEELVAVGLLHDAVERGTLAEAELRAEMGEEICSLVMTLSEDPSIASFEERKKALREQVRGAGDKALTVFAADKLSDILGLRRGIAASGDVESRIGTTVDGMARHYGDSVEVIEFGRPDSVFLPELRIQLKWLEAEAGPAST
jgi:HD domain